MSLRTRVIQILSRLAGSPTRSKRIMIKAWKGLACSGTLEQANGDAKKASAAGMHARGSQHSLLGIPPSAELELQKSRSGFKDFLLKPELLRAIVDCGFEHPRRLETRRPLNKSRVHGSLVPGSARVHPSGRRHSLSWCPVPVSPTDLSAPQRHQASHKAMCQSQHKRIW